MHEGATYLAEGSLNYWYIEELAEEIIVLIH
jgi:hypothetical protein